MFTKLGLNIEDGGTGAFHQYLAANFEPSKDDIEKSAADFNAALAKWFGNENMFLNGLISRMPNLNMWDMLVKAGLSDNMYSILSERYGPEFADALIRTYAPAVEEAAQEVADNTPDIEAENTVHLDTTIEQTTETTGETLEESMSAVEQAQTEIADLTQSANESGANVRGVDFTLDTNGVVTSANSAASAIEDMATRIRNAFATLDGLTYELDLNGAKYSGAMQVLLPPIGQYASGGFVKSGDLVMANENGNIEMMGKMGQQPVIANNQQIVSGISQGVSQANTGVVDALQELGNVIVAELRKQASRPIHIEPNSTWGEHNARSAAARDRVTG